MRTYLLDLSFPPRELNPNVRCHWAVKARCSAEAKEEGSLRMLAALKVCQYEHDETAPAPKTIKKVGIKYSFAPPDRRARDDDNLIRCMKPYRDGIALALGVDDKIFRTQECEFLEPHRPAYVRTEVTVYEDGGDGGK